jgi:MazG family protein
VRYGSIAEQGAAWEAGKAAERADKGRAASLLDDVPVGLPALTRAVKLSKRAAKVGFVWPTVGEVIAKLHEEVGELQVEIVSGDREKLRQEMGDVLFVVANLARALDIEPEDALRSTNAKFVRRFQFIEAALAARGKTPEQSDLAEMDALWDQAKAAEKG